MRRSLSRFLSTAALCGTLSSVSAAEKPGPWIPDLGNGTYRNPVLHADYSDPDAIAVGEDYWLTASSFSHAPGLPILHSRDLVNWELVNYALPTLVPADHFSSVRHGEGVWAPAIRHHGGKFWIYYPDPDFGLYLVTASDPRGKWSAPVLVKAGKGLIDPCPFWDDDGQMYLVHGWARSRGPISNRLSLAKLSADGTRPLEESVDIIDANKLAGWRTLEGPKLYKRNGYYYVFAPAGGVKEGYQAVFRSKNIYGPYENRIVLDQGGTPINGPHQGAWVETPAGEHWFLHFQDKGAFGRIVHLQPMAWRDDGWPVMGTAVATGAEKGEPVLSYRKPKLASAVGSQGPLTLKTPPTSDEFDRASLGLQWQWQANAKPEWASLTAQPGSLRLLAASKPGITDFYDAPYLLLQKFPAPEFTATTELDGTALRDGEHAGLIVFGYSFAWIGVRKTGDGYQLVHVTNVEQSKKMGTKNPGRTGETVRPLDTPKVWLRVHVDPAAKCTFSFSTDGRRFEPIETTPAFEATVARWVGAKVGLFASQPFGKPSTGPAGHADFAWFHVE